MTTLHTLASGSSGNAILVSSDETHLLIDAGISCRRITASLRTLGLTPNDLTAILITHTHSDHMSGLQTLLKKNPPPILLTGSAQTELIWKLPTAAEHTQSLPLCEPVELGNCLVTAFPTVHDSPGSCGYRLDTPSGSIGIITDTGYITDEAFSVLQGAELVVLESNHDPEALASGPYPYYLKRRIAGRYGHLSNHDAAAFAVQLAESGTAQIILAHLSHENNSPAIAHNTTEIALSAAGLHPALSVAPRDSLSET